MKLKGIDGGPHKRWSMWFNSMQSEEPYQGLTCRESSWKRGVPSGTRTQVVHGCRQLVPWGVGLSPATSATLVFSCQRLVWNPEQTAGDKPEEGEDDVKSSCPLLPWATHVLQWMGQRIATPRGWANFKNLSSVRIVGCNSPTWSRNR